jgi:multiple sugar transport system substrate-binding protein
MAALVLVAVPFAPAHAQDVTEIVFTSGPDGSGAVQRMVDAFNDLHRGKIRVQWRQMSPENDVHRQQLMDDLTSNAGGIDLMASDVVWTAELAKNRMVEDLTDRFYDAFDRDAFLATPLQSATYRLRIWGVPWYTDAGLLFYRKDKLAESGFTGPPRTWDELGEMARKVMGDSDTPYGYVFQGAEYEGGTVNAAEFIWSAGGELMAGQVTVTGFVMTGVTETDAVKVGSEAAARGLDIARSLITTEVSPAAVTSFREQESLEAFVAGDAVFLRSWPYTDGYLRRAGFTEEQFGVAPLPAADAGGRSASCLGGWNLMINASSSAAEQEAAWVLIRYLTDPAQQRLQALEAGLLPILEALYEDPDLVGEVPILALGKGVFEEQLHARPMSPFYSEVSASIASAFRRTLLGELTGSEAAELLEKELRAIVARNR